MLPGAPTESDQASKTDESSLITTHVAQICLFTFKYVLLVNLTLHYYTKIHHLIRTPTPECGWASKEDKRKLFLSMTRVHVHVYIRKSVYIYTHSSVPSSEPGCPTLLWLHGIASFGSVSDPSVISSFQDPSPLTSSSSESLLRAL